MILMISILNAQTYSTTGSGPWSWNDPSDWTCTGAGCETTPPIDIGSGVTININHSTKSSPLSVTGQDLKVQDGGTLNIINAALQSDKSLTVEKGGNLKIDGGLINLTVGEIQNEGTLNFANNNGCITLSTGKFQNKSEGNVVATGGATGAVNLDSGEIQNDGTWDTSNVKWCTGSGSSDLEASTEDCTSTATICQNAPLPVELVYFGATVTTFGVRLNWSTESEIENLGFVLERRVGNAEFTEIVSYKTDAALLGQGSVEYATDYEYLDKYVEAGQTYEYRLADVDYNETVTYHATRSVTVTTTPKSGKVEQFTVLDAYPNPFNPSTIIKYALPPLDANYLTTVQIYDLAGKLVKTLLNEQQQTGWHSITWNGTDQVGRSVPAGVYLSKVSFGSEVKTIKVMLLK